MSAPTITSLLPTTPQLSSSGVTEMKRSPTSAAKCEACCHAGCDIRIVECGCTFHARCTPLPPTHSLSHCPICSTLSTTIYLFPLSPTTSTPPILRTGRWTPEELTFVDELIRHFEAGTLPLPSRTRLHDFLSQILLCKPSRLTKKLKHANLSSKTYTPISGHVCVSGGFKNSGSAQSFSRIQDLFLKSLPEGKTEMSLQLSRRWREFFSNFCLERNQPLDAADWLSSVEDLERKDSLSKEKMKCAKRRARMGYALIKDLKQRDGVFVEECDLFHGDLDEDEERDLIGSLVWEEEEETTPSISISQNVGSYLNMIVEWMQREDLPFEHVDLWVPSFVPSCSTLRLCYGGSATRKDLQKQSELKSLIEFGEYSKKFSYEPGHGFPGRVYQSGIPNWEQSVHLAPSSHFSRCGGAMMYGVRTVLGLPVKSDSVGRIIVAMYSTNNVPKDEVLVAKCQAVFEKCSPNPQWKLVIDSGMEEDSDKNFFLGFGHVEKKPRVGDYSIGHSNSADHEENIVCHQQVSSTPNEESEIINLLGHHMPINNNDNDISGFLTLRLLLLRSPSLRSTSEIEMLKIIKSSYNGYKSVGRKDKDTALLLAKDCLHLMPCFGIANNMQMKPAQAVQAAMPFPPAMRSVSFSSSQGSTPALASMNTSVIDTKEQGGNNQSEVGKKRGAALVSDT